MRPTLLRLGLGLGLLAVLALVLPASASLKWAEPLKFMCSV